MFAYFPPWGGDPAKREFQNRKVSYVLMTTKSPDTPRSEFFQKMSAGIGMPVSRKWAPRLKMSGLRGIGCYFMTVLPAGRPFFTLCLINLRGTDAQKWVPWSAESGAWSRAGGMWYGRERRGRQAEKYLLYWFLYGWQQSQDQPARRIPRRPSDDNSFLPINIIHCICTEKRRTSSWDFFLAKNTATGFWEWSRTTCKNKDKNYWKMLKQ